jgi:DnaK suppressor protein
VTEIFLAEWNKCDGEQVLQAARQGEIMTDTRYAELRQQLQARRCELQRALGVKLREVRANHGHDGQPIGALDAADASNSELSQDIGIALTEMTAEALVRIDESLARIASGVYGRCAECDGNISHKRLAALPFAVRCLECEELHEIGERRSRQSSARVGAAFPLFDAGGRE